MTAKALAYAENELQVHKIYAGAADAEIQYNDKIQQLAHWQNERRKASEAIYDKEAALFAHLRNQHKDLSATALGDRFKVEKRLDAGLVTLRAELITAQNNEGILEAEVKSLEAGIRIATARMIELGGYLNYLAAVKEAASMTDLEKSVQATTKESTA